MHKRQKQFNPFGIKWPTEVDMLLNKTQPIPPGYHEIDTATQKITKKYVG